MIAVRNQRMSAAYHWLEHVKRSFLEWVPKQEFGNQERIQRFAS